ncbi:MAG: RNA methyltransferase [Candidatus Dojkabacteria bacterium]|nr:RNA methyltransferase [Candidatus Dojkabacteria bacterium]MDQ7020404.1 RNA methyltransferase [Candidatus Dojkabacteria bacterium]
MKFSKYKKKLQYSYTLGAYPTIELVNNKPSEIVKIIYSSASVESEAFVIIKNLCIKFNIDFIEADRQIKDLSEKENTYFIGIFNKFESKLNQNETHLVLYNPSDYGNIGTIIRTALGFGISNIALVEPAVDIFNPKVIRSSMGGIFKMNIELVLDVEKYLSNRENIYIFDSRTEKNIDTVTFKKPSTLLFGAESFGVPEELLKIGEVIKIPQSENIDSFNLAVSVGIGLYEWGRK